jgi:ubiquinone/menaquinone biosynthesis C-methylase UbiE
LFNKENAARFDRNTKTNFAPVYPVIAKQILNKTGIMEGKCIDLGSGPGPLAMAIAKITSLSILSLDLSPAMTEIAMENFRDEGLDNQISSITGNVQAIPLSEESVDLVISRGSMFFWEDKTAAFLEINRILRPGGWAYVGGGFGTPELAAMINSKLSEKNRRNRSDRHKRGRGDHNPDNYHQALSNAKVWCYDLQKDESGFWITFQKPDIKIVDVN